MTKMRRRALFGATAALVVAACVEIGGPKDGIVSISNLKLPSPSVVAGDLMRDSLGNPSPVGIIAYGSDGEPIAGQPVSFVALDTTVTIDADGTIHGVVKDTLGGRIVAGAGGLQTPPQRVIVTIAPTTATKGPDPTPIQFVVTEPDTTKDTNRSAALVLTVTGASGPAQGYVVVYSLVETPDAEVAGTPTAYIGDESARSMPRDTTDTKGVASRRVVIRQAALAAATRAGSKQDTVIVRASVKYLGADVPGSPVQFIVPVFKKP
jgi:hypothetical protein